MFYYNTKTKMYPLYEGDIKGVYPNWETDLPLPVDYVTVEESLVPEIAFDEYLVIDELQLIDDKWYQNYKVAKLSPEDLNAKTEKEKKFIEDNPYYKLVVIDSAG
jgi:hypothetical protein